MEFSFTELSPTLHRAALKGRADAASVDRVEAGFTASIAGIDGNVAVDLGGVTFMGSLGIRMLCREARVLARRGNKMVLFGVQPMVMEVFDAMALHELIPIASDEPEALAIIAG
jgi:anti-anti-sigma factor